ncbi:helix-turn-helix domain-containing protein [Bacillus mycoides]|uniref:helix-turn-helix domain-containing protein n=1 Tax=Bacillus mycoides TaxID=1405 RepID=UPI00366AC933
MNFGEYLMKKRKERNISIRELSRRTGISHPYLSQLENGRNDNPQPDKLRKLSIELNVNYLDLMIKAGYLTEDDLIKGYTND